LETQTPVYQRLAIVRKSLKLSQDLVADAAGLNRPAISKIENGTQSAGTEELMTFYIRTQNVSAEWLMTGEGDMLKQDRGGQQNKVVGNIGNLAGRNIKQTYNQGDCEQQLALALKDIEHLRERLEEKDRDIAFLKTLIK
jgi:transcriptional regulator with XRE-family HTH domain